MAASGFSVLVVARLGFRHRWMTTRRGTVYNRSRDNANGMGEETAMSNVLLLLRTMLEERKQRDEEDARRREAERQEREEEKRRSEEARERERLEREEERKGREAEKEEERRTREVESRQREEMERRRREEEWQQRDKELRAQLDLLSKLAEAKSDSSKSGSENEFRVVKLNEKDDIEAYLTTFERLMTAYAVAKTKWIFKLAPQLTGKAQQAYAALPTDQALDYDVVKAAILRRYDITEETYRQRFRASTKGVEETHRELATRLGDLANKWLKDVTTVDQIKDAVVLEQFLNCLSPTIRIWIKERKPKSVLEAGQLADDYTEARKQVKEEKNSSGDTSQKGKPSTPTPEEVQPGKGSSKDKRNQRQRWGNEDSHLTCYNCNKRGHVASKCPNKALYCGLRNAHDSTLKKSGVVEGKYVKDILLDTGCSMTLVHHKLVPEHKVLPGEVATIHCVHGDTVLYSVADLKLEVGGVPVSVKAAVSKTLPVSVLLGTDVPELGRLLGVKSSTFGENGRQGAMMVVTRAGTRKQEEEEELRRQKEVTSQVMASPVQLSQEVTELQHSSPEEGGSEEAAGESNCEERVVGQQNSEPIYNLDDDLFAGGRVRRKLTRSQKRIQRAHQSLEAKCLSGGPLDMSAGELKQLLGSDPSLKNLKTTGTDSSKTHYYLEEGLLYRRWIPRDRGPEYAVDQLVLPTQCRKAVLQLAHEVPMAGHLGKHKTAKRITQRFYWPTLYKDVEEFCRCCRTCQKSSKDRVARAPLIPLPIVTEPFRRVAMDIVGPLPRTMSGKRYILVLCDYATRYPEAVAVKAIDAECIAAELVQIFARVGIPEEILTDQGSNFTSQLLSEIYRLLHVHPIRTSPYHPQTDGLVERFNKTLKAMLRKIAADDIKNWDKWLPFLLFAYREVPQASTGFAPFELLYGRAVKGPLDIVKESWKETKQVKENVVSYVLGVQDKLAKMSSLAAENLQRAQKQQKMWYDGNARQREFQIGDLVLVLLPTSAGALTAQWKGPYPILQKIGAVNYVVDMHGTRKRERTFHINMLKRWNTAKDRAYFAAEGGMEEEAEEEDIPEWRGGEVGESRMGKQLTVAQLEQLQGLLHEFQDVMNSAPGRTTMAEHNVRPTDSKPIRLAPYRLPHAYRELVRKEIEEMLAAGIIEPSRSEWSAPIVLVNKKDSTLRMCVDYRRLNAASLSDAYPMPRIEDLIDGLGKVKFITTLDLSRGYWQVPMADGARHLTAFTTPFGLYQFRVMPFGLKGAPATFQRLMDTVLQGLQDFSAAYIDDLAIHSDSWDDHLRHVRAVLQRLREAGLTAKPKKCQFGMDQCVYLGYVVGNGVIQPERSKLQGVESFPTPSTKIQVQCFLGLTGYYRKFIPNYASLATPLTNLIRKCAANKVVWTQECEEAFQRLKALLCANPVLRSPDLGKEFVLQTDASCWCGFEPNRRHRVRPPSRLLQ